MEADDRTVRILCSKKALLASNPSVGIRWLIGSPRFISRLTIVASFRCLHTLPADPFSPDFSKEAGRLPNMKYCFGFKLHNLVAPLECYPFLF